VFLHEEIPEDQFWHFKHSKWTPPIFMLADVHWSILGIHVSTHQASSQPLGVVFEFSFSYPLTN
jgi:carbonic anhydrase